MKKTFLFLMTLCFFAFTNKAFAQTYSGGNGTENNPYLISSNADMVSLANAVNNGYNYSQDKYFLLTRNLAGKIAVSSLSKGIYIVNIHTDNGVVVCKIVKE